MIPRIEVIITKNGEIYRQSFKLPNVPVEQFDSRSHWNVHFNWGGEEGFEKDGIRVWTHVELSEEERQQLIDQGKLSNYKPKDSENL